MQGYNWLKPLRPNGLGNLYLSFYYCKPSRFSIALHMFEQLNSLH